MRRLDNTPLGATIGLSVTIMKLFGKEWFILSKIRKLRKDLKLSISRLSQEARVNASVVSWVELGKLAASPAVRASLAKFYGKPVESLFSKSGMAV